MKNRNESVGQASRLSYIQWMRHLPHYQLSSGYYFITFCTHDRFLLRPPEKDCVLNEDEFLEELNYIASNPTRLLTLERSDGGQVKASLARQYEDYKWLYIKGWIKDD